MGYIIIEFCGLRSKMYSIKIEGANKNHTEAKLNHKSATAGVMSHVAARDLQHEKFVKVLTGETKYEVIRQRTMRSEKHIVYNIEEQKLVLSAIDDKRYVLANHHTRALGHKDNV